MRPLVVSTAASCYQLKILIKRRMWRPQSEETAAVYDGGDCYINIRPMSCLPIARRSYRHQWCIGGIRRILTSGSF